MQIADELLDGWILRGFAVHKPMHLSLASKPGRLRR
jgi:hypothetical protein